MRTRRFIVSLFAAALGLVVIGWGCNKQQSAKGTDPAATQAAAMMEGSGGAVGVVNYEKVLRDLLWFDKWQSNLQAAQANLAKELAAAVDKWKQQLTEVAAKNVKGWDTMSAEQRQQILGQLAGQPQLQAGFAQLKQQAQERYNAYSADWLRRYKDALGPIVRQAAQQRKITIVMQQNDTLVFVDSSVDLTNAVVDGARSTPPVITDVPMPVLTVQPLNIVMNGPTTSPTTMPATFPTTLPASTQP